MIQLTSANGLQVQCTEEVFKAHGHTTKNVVDKHTVSIGPAYLVREDKHYPVHKITIVGPVKASRP